MKKILDWFFGQEVEKDDDSDLDHIFGQIITFTENYIKFKDSIYDDVYVKADHIPFRRILHRDLIKYLDSVSPGSGGDPNAVSELFIAYISHMHFVVSPYVTDDIKLTLKDEEFGIPGMLQLTMNMLLCPNHANRFMSILRTPTNNTVKNYLTPPTV